MSRGTLEKESTFHDTWALSTSPEDVPVREAFEAPTAPENRFILCLLDRRPGGLGGKLVLDLACGLGESSAYLALRGARIVAVDLAPAMARMARAVASLHGSSVEAAAASASRLPLPDAAFDVVYLANAIHHVPRRDLLFNEVRRVLRPGGLFVSWDPLAYNPVINLYRRMAQAVRTEDEAPLRLEILHLARRRFPDLRFRCFWIATLLLFLKYYLIDRVHPGRERYWKRILRESDRTLWWWQPLRAMDAILTRLPYFRRLSWNIVLWGTKPRTP